MTPRLTDSRRRPAGTAVRPGFLRDGGRPYAPPERPSGRTPHQAVSAWHKMVATANPLSTAAGYAVLRQGGSAVDAAVAIQMVLNLVEPQSSGIGGGAFMLVHDARRGKPLVYDGRETAPVAARPDRFLDESGRPLRFFAAVVGGRSVGVPGTLRMLGAAMQVVDQNGGLQIIVRTRGGWRGAADSRREGTVQGD